jgi:hypothetical protein
MDGKSVHLHRRGLDPGDRDLRGPLEEIASQVRAKIVVMGWHRVPAHYTHVRGMGADLL